MRSDLEWWQLALPLLATAGIMLVVALAGEKGRRIIGDACQGILSGRAGTRSSRVAKIGVSLVMTLIAAKTMVKLLHFLWP
jgi:hypothetical protein